MGTKRRVHFLPQKNMIIEIESYKIWTSIERRNSFFSASFFRKVVEKRSDAALEWEADKSCGLYMRGLEQYTKEGEKRISRTINRRFEAVLDEQDLQWEREEDDFDRLAEVSQQISRFSVGLALLRAEEDEIEAQRAYQSMERLKSKKQKRIIEEQPILVLDDPTSVCSDLGLSNRMESLHLRNLSIDTADSDLEMIPENVPVTNERTKKRTSATLVSPDQTRDRLDAMRSKILEISDVLYTMKT